MRGPDSNTGSGLLDRLSPICHRDAPPLSGPHRPSAAREMAPDCRVRNDCYCLASRRLFGHCCRVSTPSPPVPPAPDGEDLRGLARGMRHLLELAAQTLSAEAGPSGLALRVTGHLGCELTEVVLVSARFPIWEQVNVQRGADAYLAAHAAGAQWFGPAGGGHRPHEDVLSLLSMPSHAVTASDVVLPDGVLEHIERHIIGIADWSAELLGAGQHLKRGLLLHGPPGTGKTHTVRYLTSRLASLTVILLTGRSIRFIDQAAALARRLQPSMVVLEDVDLVAVDRDYTPGGNPLLFSLLDAMDGIGADADVTFVLTTNRADILETALADRPGRVDLAVEIPRPDAHCRERLLRVYARDLTVDADLGQVVAGTEGVTASFIKEMIRRTVLASLRAGERPPVLRGPHFADVLAEMNSEHHALTRSLLGAGAEGPAREPAHRPGPARGRH